MRACGRRLNARVGVCACCVSCASMMTPCITVSAVASSHASGSCTSPRVSCVRHRASDVASRDVGGVGWRAGPRVARFAMTPKINHRTTQPRCAHTRMPVSGCAPSSILGASRRRVCKPPFLRRCLTVLPPRIRPRPHTHPPLPAAALHDLVPAHKADACAAASWYMTEYTCCCNRQVGNMRHALQLDVAT